MFFLPSATVKGTRCSVPTEARQLKPCSSSCGWELAARYARQDTPSACMMDGSLATLPGEQYHARGQELWRHLRN